MINKAEKHINKNTNYKLQLTLHRSKTSFTLDNAVSATYSSCVLYKAGLFSSGINVVTTLNFKPYLQQQTAYVRLSFIGERKKKCFKSNHVFKYLSSSRRS
jgi:hypothetical protein